MGLIDDIKKSAEKGGAKIQSTTEREIETSFNKLFYLDKDIEEEAKFVKMVMTRGLESQERIGLHASSFIVSDSDWCLRRQVLSLIYKQSQGEDIPVGLMRIFEEGNAVHEKWQRLLIRGGYGKAKTMDRTRFKDEYLISYTPDGVLKMPQLFGNEPIVLEIKSMGMFPYKKMIESNGKHPSAHKQGQFYLWLTGYKHLIVLVDNKNSQEFKVEYYDYDEKVVEPFVERADNVKESYKDYLESGRIPSRCSDCKKHNCKKAMDCCMRNACWDIGFGKIRLDDKEVKENE